MTSNTVDDFTVLEASGRARYCLLGPAEGFPDEYLLRQGRELGPIFPADVYFQMAADRPKQVELADVVANRSGVLIISPRLQEFFRGTVRSGVEYLSVRVEDHKGRAVPQQYVIFNPVVIVDCIDAQNSKVIRSKVNPAVIMDIDQLVLDGSKIPPDLSVFRIAGIQGAVILRNELAREIERRGFTGCFLQALADFNA